MRYNKILESFFFSNYFYGICAVALSVEATLQQRFPLNGFLYFFLIFLTTVLYYTYPYVRKSSHESSNPRTNWYTRNYPLMWWNQVIITVILITCAVLLFLKYRGELLHLHSVEYFLVFLFPIVAALYYGLNLTFIKYNLRKTGWLKPFVIGFTWAGVVTVYPVLFHEITHNRRYEFNYIGGLLFLKNFMFVSVLCIIFDIKDYAMDHASRINTFVVKLGLRKTIFSVLIPVSVSGTISFIYYAFTHQFYHVKILLNVIPFVLLISAILSLCRKRPLMYYLVTIDGLMLAKGVCGTIAILYF